MILHEQHAFFYYCSTHCFHLKENTVQVHAIVGISIQINVSIMIIAATFIIKNPALNAFTITIFVTKIKKKVQTKF